MASSRYDQAPLNPRIVIAAAEGEVLESSLQCLHIDFGGGETGVLDRIGSSVYATFGEDRGNLTSVQVFDDPESRDPATFDIVRSLVGPTIADFTSEALQKILGTEDIIDGTVAVPSAEATELQASWAELHPLLARRLDFDKPWPPTSEPTPWKILKMGVAIIHQVDDETTRLVVPAGLARRTAINPELQMWVDKEIFGCVANELINALQPLSSTCV